MPHEYRKPTVEEAVAFMLRSQTREYRAICLAHWRQKFGDAFADEIEERVKQKWERK